MEFKKVIINFKSSDFPLTGVPFTLIPITTYPKEGKKYKSEYEDFVNLTKNLKFPISQKDVISMPDTIGTTLNLSVFNGLVKTFKFFGMDITEDLDVVVKGKIGMVYVGNLCNPKGIALGAKAMTGNLLNDKQLSVIEVGLNKDIVKESIEDLKFNKIFSLTDFFNNSRKQFTKYDAESNFNFFHNIIDNISKVRSSGFGSVILSFVGNEYIQTDTIDIEVLKKAVYGGMCNYWAYIIERYSDISKIVSMFDIFLDLNKKIFGKNETIDKVKKSVTDGEYGDVGCFEGYCKDENVEGRSLQCTLAKSFLMSVGKVYLRGNSEMEFTADKYMSTMFEVPNNTDMSILKDKKTCLAYSVLDGLQYNDPDLTMVANQYDMSNMEEKENFLKNVIVGYKKKFTNYMNDLYVDIDDEIIKNVLPQDNTSIDILNVGTKNDIENTDIEVSRVSFNKTNLMNSNKLIEKVLKMIVKGLPAK